MTRTWGTVAPFVVLFASGCRVGSDPSKDATPALAASVVALDAGHAGTSDRTHESARAGDETFEADWFSFALADVRVSIVDVQATRDLARTLSKPEAVFATNAGFFDERDAPLGLSVTGGARMSAFAPKLSGGVLEIDHGKATLFETETYDRARLPDFAVQCRPRLVVAGHPNVRSDDKKRAERTAVCLREGGTKLAFVIAKNAERGPSLFALGRYLAEKGCHDALSLDGGPSTGAVYQGPGGLEEMPLRGPIRQAILVTRPKAP
jgi:uncharacterized protein YigE (DUF2233 family)